YQHWGEIQTKAKKFGEEIPNLVEIIREVQSITTNWDIDGKSYVRDYLRKHDWGRDEKWKALAHDLFDVMQSIYLMPLELQVKLSQHIREQSALPETDLFRQWLYSDEDMIEDLPYLFEQVELRSEMAAEALTRANLRLVVSVAKRY